MVASIFFFKSNFLKNHKNICTSQFYDIILQQVGKALVLQKWLNLLIFSELSLAGSVETIVKGQTMALNNC